MNGDSEPEPLRAGNFFPGADDILSRSDIDAIPRLVFRVPAIEVSMVIGECDEIFGPGPGVEPNQFRGVPVLRPPDMTDVFVPELRRVAVGFDVVVVLRTALNVHASGIPIALLGNTLRAPMSPDAELRIAEPIGEPVGSERFPIRAKRTRDRGAGKIAV